MWDTHPKHGILEFKSMPKMPLTLDDIGAVKPNIKRNIRRTYVKRSSTVTWNNI
jgi:hypothetical protein